MNKGCVLYFGFLMFLSFFSYCQGRLGTDRLVTRITNNRLTQGAKQYEAEGHPYLQEEFVLSEVKANDGKVLGILMRYNIYEDYMEFKQRGNFYLLNPDKSIEKISLGTDQFVVEDYEANGKLKAGYFQLLDSGRMSFMAKKVVKYSEAQEPSPMKYDGTPAKFERVKDVYYIKIEKFNLIKVESIKKIISNLPSHQAEMTKFLKDNDLSKSEADILKLVRFYNSLQSK